MSEAGNAVLNSSDSKTDAADAAQNRMTELKVSGHLMTLDAGVFCVFHAPGKPAANDPTGLPGVRISLPPGASGRPDAVSISTFRDDGWLASTDGAALVRVTDGPAQVLVTIYQSPTASADTAPRLQVVQLNQDAAATKRAPANAGTPAPEQAPASQVDIVAHLQRTGDVGGKLGDWIGVRGNRSWIEGFAVSPVEDVAAEDIEYQAVLGRGWLSPWVEGAKFCGSRGMALPLLGLKLRLKGDAAKKYDLSYSATFVDGSAIGPVAAGEACEAESLAALEAFQIVVQPRGSAAGASASPAPAPAAKPAPVRKAPTALPPRGGRPSPGVKRAR